VGKARLPAVVATAVAGPAAAVARVVGVDHIVTAKAPDSVAELPARPVEGGEHASEFVLAYGDPAVVATCGAEALEVEDTAVVYMLDGVCWFTDEDGDGTEWTTVDRRVPVEVTVPADHEQPVDVLNGLSEAIGEAVPVSEDAPSGCS
jgi:hypothetical protein